MLYIGNFFSQKRHTLSILDQMQKAFRSLNVLQERGGLPRSSERSELETLPCWRIICLTSFGRRRAKTARLLSDFELWERIRFFRKFVKSPEAKKVSFLSQIWAQGIYLRYRVMCAPKTHNV